MPKTIDLKIEQLHPDAVIPQYATDGAGCFDLHAVDAEFYKPHPTDDRAAIFRTGLAFQVPAGWVMEIHSRSGQGFNDAIRLSNCTGQIDSDYTGEVMVSLRIDADSANGRPAVQTGDRIAQAKLVKSPRCVFVVVDKLTETVRGAGGFGSTGR